MISSSQPRLPVFGVLVLWCAGGLLGGQEQAPLQDARETVKGSSTGSQRLIEEGYAMSSNAATQLEKSLDDSPDDLNSRVTLIAFYTSHFQRAEPQILRAARARHILWLIEHHPNAEVLGLPVSLINGLGESLDDVDSFRKGKELWGKQIASSPDDIPTLEHAALYLLISDKEGAERLILRLMQSNRTYTAWLGKLYGLAILGVTSVDYRTGQPRTTSPDEQVSDFSKRALSSVEVSGDPGLLSSAVRFVTEAGVTFRKAGALPADYQPICQQIAEKANALHVSYPVDCGGLEQATRIRVGGNVQAVNLLRKVTPAYPDEAKLKGVQGTVRFAATIGADGAIKDLQLVSGHPLLIKAAFDPVRQWKYKPTLLNGRPVEVLTQIDVNYTLSQ